MIIVSYFVLLFTKIEIIYKSTINFLNIPKNTKNKHKYNNNNV